MKIFALFVDRAGCGCLSGPSVFEFLFLPFHMSSIVLFGYRLLCIGFCVSRKPTAFELALHIRDNKIKMGSKIILLNVAIIWKSP